MSWHRFHGLLIFFQTFSFEPICSGLFSWCISFKRKFSPRHQVALSNLSLFVHFLAEKWTILLHARTAPHLRGWWERRRWSACRPWCWPVCGWATTGGASRGTARRRSSTCTRCAWCWGWSSCKVTVSQHRSVSFASYSGKLWCSCRIRLTDGIVGADIQTLKLVTQPARVPLFTALGVYHPFSSQVQAMSCWWSLIQHF